jgi:hypothetical protein
MWGSLSKVTVVGYPIVMQDLEILCWYLRNYKSHDNILVLLSRIIESAFLNDISLVIMSQSTYITSLPFDSTEGDSITSFDNPRRVIW